MTVILTISITAIVSASNEIRIMVEGERLYTDVPPRIINGRTMVPIRAVSEAVGCEVQWNAQDQSIVVNLPSGNATLIMRINSPVAFAYIESGSDGSVTEEILLVESPPVIINGRTLVPLRFIAEFIGFEVGWDPGSQIVYIYTL